MSSIPRTHYGICTTPIYNEPDREMTEEMWDEMQRQKAENQDSLAPIRPFWARASLSLGLPRIKEDK